MTILFLIWKHMYAELYGSATFCQTIISNLLTAAHTKAMHNHINQTFLPLAHTFQAILSLAGVLPATHMHQFGLVCFSKKGTALTRLSNDHGLIELTWMLFSFVSPPSFQKLLLVLEKWHSLYFLLTIREIYIHTCWPSTTFPAHCVCDNPQSIGQIRPAHIINQPRFRKSSSWHPPEVVEDLRSFGKKTLQDFLIQKQRWFVLKQSTFPEICFT